MSFKLPAGATDSCGVMAHTAGLLLLSWEAWIGYPFSGVHQTQYPSCRHSRSMFSHLSHSLPFFVYAFTKKKLVQTSFFGTGFWCRVQLPLGLPAYYIGVPRVKIWLHFLFQIPANHTWEAASNGSRTWALPPAQETQMEFLLLTSAWPNPRCCFHLRREPTSVISLSLCLSNKVSNFNVFFFKVYFYF